MQTDTTPRTLLIEIPGLRWSSDQARTVRQQAAGVVLDILTAVDVDETWIYTALDSKAPEPLLSALRAAIAQVSPGHAIRHRTLQALTTLGNTADGRAQPWHYTSQTDIPADTEAEFNQWFDEEHLPALAGLDGTVHACRYRTDGSPRYLASYDLKTRDTQGSPIWRAAIDTPWRDRMHPRFVNPRRVMFQRLP
ncbi:hypothetical protein ANDO1_3116 [plant metagenome]|uniref:Uncharacterized protein n=1 Tax=plant metagenome TaxID=1297885 RepID=A0A484QGA7_9ZZZZ